MTKSKEATTSVFFFFFFRSCLFGRWLVFTLIYGEGVHEGNGCSFPFQIELSSMDDYIRLLTNLHERTQALSHALHNTVDIVDG